eukprot:jgi/Mesen1/6175/ME000032S05465
MSLLGRRLSRLQPPGRRPNLQSKAGGDAGDGQLAEILEAVEATAAAAAPGGDDEVEAPKPKRTRKKKADAAPKKPKEPPPPPPVDPWVAVEEASEAARVALGGRRKLGVKRTKPVVLPDELAPADEAFFQPSSAELALLASAIPKAERQKAEERDNEAEASGEFDKPLAGGDDVAAASAHEGGVDVTARVGVDSPDNDGGGDEGGGQGDGDGEGEGGADGAVAPTKAKRVKRRTVKEEEAAAAAKKQAELEQLAAAGRAVVEEMGALGMSEPEVEEYLEQLDGRDRRRLRNGIRVMNMVPREASIERMEDAAADTGKKRGSLKSQQELKHKERDLDELARAGQQWYMLAAPSGGEREARNDLRKAFRDNFPELDVKVYAPDLKNRSAGGDRAWMLRLSKGIVYVHVQLSKKLYLWLVTLPSLRGFIGTQTEMGRGQFLTYPMAVDATLAARFDHQMVEDEEHERAEAARIAELERAKQERLSALGTRARTRRRKRVEFSPPMHRAAAIRITEGKLKGYIGVVLEVNAKKHSVYATMRENPESYSFFSDVPYEVIEYYTPPNERKEFQR